MNIVLLDTLTFGDTDLSAFADLGEVHYYETTSKEQTQERIKDADIVVTNKVLITRELIQNTPKLKLICVAATGMNNIDLQAAKEHNIEVKNVAGYSTDSVVQHTFSILFYLIGHARYYDDVVKSGRYSKAALFTDVSHPFFEIKGKRWGIIGLGEIGRGVAKVAKSFGAQIVYHSTSGTNLEQEYNHLNLLELLESCDIISIHAPLNEHTKNLLDYDLMMRCKKNAVILNLGRGGIINEEAIAKIIDERELSFGLDVLEQEPLAQDHPLLDVKNKQRLYITPHIAWASEEAREKLISLVCENIQNFKG